MPIELYIPKNHPALAGHFPGRPTIPAALLLTELTEKLEGVIGLTVSQIKRAQFRAIARPGEKLSMDIEPKANSEYRFKCSAAGKTIISGTVSTGEPCPSEPVNNSPGCQHSTEQVAALDAAPLYDALPHHGDMCLLRQITNHRREDIQCLSHPLHNNPRHKNPLGSQQRLNAWSTLEYAAQACALHGLLQHNPSARAAASSTWVASTRDFTRRARDIPLNGEALQINTRVLSHQLSDEKSAAKYAFSAAINGRSISSGQLMLIFN